MDPKDQANLNNQPPVGGGGEDAPNGGSSTNLPAQEEVKVLESLKVATGRDFPTIAEFKKHYGNLSSLVGDQVVVEAKKKAGDYDVLKRDYDNTLSVIDTQAKEQGLTREQYLAKFNNRQTVLSPEIESALKDVASMKDRDAERDFLAEYPYAKDVIKEVRAIAKTTGQSFSEAFVNSNLAKFVKPNSGGEAVLGGTRGISQDSSQYQNAFEKARKSGDWREVLRMKGVLS